MDTGLQHSIILGQQKVSTAQSLLILVQSVHISAGLVGLGIRGFAYSLFNGCNLKNGKTHILENAQHSLIKLKHGHATTGSEPRGGTTGGPTATGYGHDGDMLQGPIVAKHIPTWSKHDIWLLHFVSVLW